MTKNKDTINDYLFEDNIIRFALKVKLSKKTYLQSLTLENLDDLIRTINVLISNLNHNFEKGKKKFDISDEHNWSANDELIDILLHNVLDFDPQDVGGKELKKKIMERWGIKSEER